MECRSWVKGDEKSQLCNADVIVYTGVEWSGDAATALTHVALRALWLCSCKYRRLNMDAAVPLLLSGPCLGEQVFIHISPRKN